LNKIIKLVKQLKRNKLSINLIGYYYKRTLPLVYYPFVKKRIPKKIVFFIGNQGDGMSFVTRVLRKHNNLISISGNHNYWSGADEIATVMEPVLPYSLRLPGLLTKERIKTTLSPPRSWSYGADNFFDHYLANEEDYNEIEANTFLKIISTALWRFGSDKIFIDKSQVYSLKMKLLQKIFKDRVHFVHITRNPLISCYRAASGKAGDLKRYSEKLDFEDLLDISIQHWNNISVEISSSKKAVTNYSRFKIEDILDNPSFYFNEICKSIGIEFNSSMLPKPNDKIPHFSKYKDRWFPIRKDINSSYLLSMNSEIKNKIKKNLNQKIAIEQGYKL